MGRSFMESSSMNSCMDNTYTDDWYIVIDVKELHELVLSCSYLSY